MKAVYALLCVAGLLLPYGAFLPWLFEHGVDLPLLLQQAMATPIALFAWLDVLVAGVVLLVFIVVEGQRRRMRLLWLPVLATLGVGVSLGLPLFLLLREQQAVTSQGAV
jgi:hypothetical protein